MTTNGAGRALACPRYYRRRATVQAMQWDGTNTEAVAEWFGPENVEHDGNGTLLLRGATDVHLHQWIVLSPNDRLHICVPGLFEEVHELALTDPPYSDEANMAAAMAAAIAAKNYWKKMAESLAKKQGVELPSPPPNPIGVANV